MKNAINTFLSACLIVLGALSTGHAAPGDLDLTFGNGGIVVTPFTGAPYWPQANSILVQPDSKILVCGQIWEDDGYGTEHPVSHFIGRYLPSGVLDASFGVNGKVLSPYSNGFYAGREIALQTDGKIVSVGHQEITAFSILVARYNSNGTLDISFGTGGLVMTPVAGQFSFGRKVIVQSDGRIVVAGFTYLGGNFFTLVVARYNSNGSLDTTFGEGGISITPAGSDSGWVSSVSLQTDGKILIAGGSEHNRYFSLVRYNANGSPDQMFGTNGKVVYGFSGPSWFTDAVIQSDGKILAAGISNGQPLIIRHESNGSIDRTFGREGVVLTGFSRFAEQTIDLQADTKILVFGGGVSVLRLKANGVLDTGFGSNGRVTTPVGLDGWGISGVVQPDGKILGLATASSGVGMVRYRGDSAIPRANRFDFDGDGRSDVSVFRPSDRTWYLDRSTAGFDAIQFGLSTDEIAPADFDGDGKADISIFRDGVWWWINSADRTVGAKQFGIAGDIPTPADYSGDGRAELAVYRNGIWWTHNLSNNQSTTITFGLTTDNPVPADYDGDGRTDQAVYRNGGWHINRSTMGYIVVSFGLSTDIPIPTDYDGDGKTDPAVYRNGTWYVQQSTQGFTAFQWGFPTDIPVPADYDGDGRTDAAVFRAGVWYLRQSTNGVSIQQFGLSDDKPVPSAFLP